MLRLLHDESAQNAFEYILVVGAIVAAMALLFMGFDAMIAAILSHVCPAVDTGGAFGSCVTP